MDPRRLSSPTGTSLEPLEKLVYQRMKLFKPQIEGTSLILAVSGGIDSIVLTFVMQALQSRLGVKLHIVHVNHGIRGEMAEQDALFVKETAKQFHIPVTIKRLQGINPNAGEALLREKRYSILKAAQRALKASFIVVAHHRDDLLETRLMRLLQGAGIQGLKAMTEVSPEMILRPFLSVTRKEIKEYAIKKDIAWRNDATNEDTKKLRNWIRRTWLSVLRREHPEYVDNLFESLDRAVKALQTEPKTLEPQFDRRKLKTKSDDEEAVLDHLVYNYLRQFASNRVTSRHVAEFKKRLKTVKKSFSFKLAGRRWTVSQNIVAPDLT